MLTVLVPKNRKPKFDITFRIIDLNNIPYVSGRIYVRCHLHGSGDSANQTAKAPIKDHKAFFEYERSSSVRLVVDKNGILQDSTLDLDVIHEVSSGDKSEKSFLGRVKINVAEYVESTRYSQEQVERRYLLQESKVNSTIKVGIHMNQTEGDRIFHAPPLRSAAVFVGIAGVMAGEQAETQQPGEIPAVSSQNREAGDELRELYRKTIAAGFSSQPGELSADHVIEEIFSGGDGFGGRRNLRGQPGGGAGFGGGSGANNDARSSEHQRSVGDAGYWSDGEMRSVAAGAGDKGSWPDFTYGKRNARASREPMQSSEEVFRSGAISRPRGSFGAAGHVAEMDKGWSGSVPEVDELDVRDDLRCWNSRV